ncbi:hypothetical protein GGS20DRAFT_595561 [Poronia punctata]|nr:hypothetical protein GGS20DRAFT_595561 [Poronia punctata]
MPRKRNTPKVKAKTKRRARGDASGSRIGSSSAHSHGIFRDRPFNSGSFTDMLSGYTLAEEARNTASNRRGNRGRDARLRDQPVIFISAGFLDPLKLYDLPSEARGPIPNSPVINAASCLCDSDIVHPPVTTKLDHRTADAATDYGSDSCEEIILFRGRNASRRQETKPSPAPTDAKVNRSPAAGMDEIKSLRPVDDAAEVSVEDDPPISNEYADYVAFRDAQRRGSRLRRPWSVRHTEEDDEAAIIADYISNMREGFDAEKGSDTDREGDDDDGDDDEDTGYPGTSHCGFNIFRDLGGTDSDTIPSQASSGDETRDDSNAEHEVDPSDEYPGQLIAEKAELGRDSEDAFFCHSEPDSGEKGWIPVLGAARRTKKRAPGTTGLIRRGSQFPSATQMADAFDAMDILDTGIYGRQKAKRGTVFFDLSDSELEGAMKASLERDRLKKAQKKKAREALRSQGLLGKPGNPSDLRLKYRGGMTLDDLADELETFLLGTLEQLILPPFDKGARKIVHSIANTFKIKSKSAGVGIGRHPILYRSKATLPYDQDTFGLAFNHVKRTWFPRVDVNESVSQDACVLRQAAAHFGKGRRASKSSLVLREGQIVGQHAAEIGAENKGRAMLEKMGWSKGMSLGTGATKGIIVPLMHVVKKSKAGLGEV